MLNDKQVKRNKKLWLISLRLTQFGRCQTFFMPLFIGWFEVNTMHPVLYLLGGSISIWLICELIAWYVDNISSKICYLSSTGKHEYAIHRVSSALLLDDDQYQRVNACKHCKTVKTESDWWSD